MIESLSSVCSLNAANFWRVYRIEISARNTLKGTVKAIEHGAVNSEVAIELPCGIEIVSIITKHSVERLNLLPGSEVYALIKADATAPLTSKHAPPCCSSARLLPPRTPSGLTYIAPISLQGVNLNHSKPGTASGPVPASPAPRGIKNTAASASPA